MSKVMECKNGLIYRILYTICFKRKKKPDTKKVLMCICVKKNLNKKNLLFYDTKLVKIRIKALKVLK